MIDKMEMENKNSKALQILQEYVKSKRIAVFTEDYDLE